MSYHLISKMIEDKKLLPEDLDILRGAFFEGLINYRIQYGTDVITSEMCAEIASWVAWATIQRLAALGKGGAPHTDEDKQTGLYVIDFLSDYWLKGYVKPGLLQPESGVWQ